MHLPVETSRTHDRRVQNIHTVRRRHNDNSLIDTETVHLNEHLVQCLLALIVTAAHTGTTPSCDSIDLIDKHDTRRIFLGFLKQITDTRSADANKHLHKIRTGNTKERHACLTGNRLCQKCLTGSRRSHEKNTLWNTRAKPGILLRGTQEIHDLLKLFLFLFQTCHIGKCHPLCRVICHELCAALAEVHHLTAAAGIGSRLIGHNHEENEHRRKNNQIRKYRHDPALLRRILHGVRRKLLIAQIVFYIIYIVYRQNLCRGVLKCNVYITGRHLAAVRYNLQLCNISICNRSLKLCPRVTVG